MENLSFEKYGKFDGIMFLGTIYHSEKPWEIPNKISKMTDLVIIESQISFPKEVNSTVGEYQFKAFEEGPGTDLDDPEKNYLRQVRR